MQIGSRLRIPSGTYQLQPTYVAQTQLFLITCLLQRADMTEAGGVLASKHVALAPTVKHILVKNQEVNCATLSYFDRFCSKNL